MEGLIDIAKASELLSISKKTLYVYNCRKIIPYYKIGSRVLYSPAALEKWLRDRLVKPISEKLLE